MQTSYNISDDVIYSVKCHGLNIPWNRLRSSLESHSIRSNIVDTQVYNKELNDLIFESDDDSPELYRLLCNTAHTIKSKLPILT